MKGEALLLRFFIQIVKPNPFDTKIYNCRNHNKVNDYANETPPHDLCISDL